MVLTVDSYGSLCSLLHQAGHNDRGYVALSSDPAQASTHRLLPPETFHAAPHGGSLVVHGDGSSYTYAYGPGGLAGLKHNYFALACAVFASIGGLTFGYDQGVIANILVMKEFVKTFPVTSWEKGLMSAQFCSSSDA